MLHLPGSAKPLCRDRQGARAPSVLGDIVGEIACACDEPAERMAARIVPALASAAADPQLLAPGQSRPQAEGYARHVLYADPAGRFTLLALVWDAGQFSPPHAHHIWCGYAVRSGVLTETLFAYDAAAGLARPTRVAVRAAGHACFAGSGLDQIHRLGNAGAEPAISIHVYGVARDRIATHVNRIVEVAPAEG